MRFALPIAMILVLILAACEVEDAAEDVDVADQPTPTEVVAEEDETPTATPELTPTATPVPEEEQETPTPEPTPEPDPTPTPEAEAEEEIPEEIAGEIDVQVGQFGYYVTTTGSIQVFGELENHGDGHAEIQEVLITLRDEDGRVLDSGTSYSHISVIEGGGRVPFTHRLVDAPEDFAEIEFQIEARDPEDAWLVIFENYREFEALQADWREGDWDNSIVGEIENVGDEAADFVQIFVVGYDSEGTLVMVEYTYADRDLIRPGETSPFTVRVENDQLTEPEEIVVYAEGWIADD